MHKTPRFNRRRFDERVLARIVRGCFSQGDQDIANQAGAAFRSDLNLELKALVSNNSGATAPSTTYAYQWWADTANGVMKQRNAANSAWIEKFKLTDTWETGTFTGTLTGCTTSPTATITYVLANGVVTLSWATNLSGTSNAPTKTITGLPAALYPARTINQVAMTGDNGGAYAAALMQLDTSGVMNFYKDEQGTAFTNSGTAQIRYMTFSYPLA